MAAVGVTSKPQNIEPQNYEGCFRCALSFIKKQIQSVDPKVHAGGFFTDRIPSCDIRHSVFDIQYSRYTSSFIGKLTVSAISSGFEPWTPEPLLNASCAGS